ncbi:MAG: uroporphyrinogen decarboxylase family protein [Bacillota bacterium]
MNSKERVRTALSFAEPDRVPVSAAYVPEISKRLRTVVGDGEPDLGVALGNDLVLTAHGFATGYYLEEDDEYYDEWGCKWKYFQNKTGSYPEIIERPLQDETMLDSYRIPDPYIDSRYETSNEIIAQYGKDFWIVGAIPCSIFEAAWGLRGLDTLLMDMVCNKDFAHALMDKVMEFPLAAGQKLIDLGADMLWTGDDVAMQTGMLMSPEMWREFLKPRYAAMFREFKRANPKIKLAYHCDGNCESILDEMHEIGLDVINPVQPACMNPAEIKKKYGKKLALWGTMDIQRTLPFGTPGEVRAAVNKLIATCAAGGGFILAPAHNIQSDTSVENIMEFYKAARDYGGYPLAGHQD